MTGMEHVIEQAAALFDFTDEEWRKYQSIPDQGYSHRDWLNHRNRKRIEALAEAGLLAPAPLAEVQADAWDEGWEACHAFMGRGIFPPRTNPYRNGAGQ